MAHVAEIKQKEIEIVNKIYDMATESLSPGSFEKLEEALLELCGNRHIRHGFLTHEQRQKPT